MILDLVFFILQRVHEDEDTLRACSRVCKSWSSIAQALLFHTVTIGLKSTHNVLFDRGTWSLFLELLQLAPHLGPLVQVLNVFAYYNGPDDREFLSQMGLVNVHTLTVTKQRFTANLLSSLPSVVNVSVIRIQGVEDMHTIIDPTRLQSLHIDAEDSSTLRSFMQWFGRSSQATRSSLSSLHVCFHNTPSEEPNSINVLNVALVSVSSLDVLSLEIPTNVSNLAVVLSLNMNAT
jgi:hypothetical protein